MAEKHDVIIYKREILLDVVIPLKYVCEFMAKFGRVFYIKGIREVGADWHIQVNVSENDEHRFYEFLWNFCAERNLSFREPEVQPKDPVMQIRNGSGKMIVVQSDY